MLAKLLVTVAFACVIGLIVLDARQRQIGSAHEIARLYRQVHDARHEAANLRSRIEAQASPTAIAEAVEASELPLMPAVPDAGPPTVAHVGGLVD
ncbi:MAG: hypothetical protein AAF823_10615 [Planctomycetota bacterium]